MWINKMTGSMMNLEEIGVFMREVFEFYDLEPETDNYLNDTYGPFTIGNTKYTAANILKSVDEYSYKKEYNETIEFFINQTLTFLRYAEENGKLEEDDSVYLSCDYPMTELRDIVWKA